MASYESVKKWLETHKDKFVLAGSFVLMFLVGFGSGRYVRPNLRQTVRTNYNTNSSQQSKTSFTAPKETPAAQTAGADSSCPVKGNISAAGKKIYHVPGGSFYKTVKPEQCFKTESEATAAGFIKSSR